jgi:hypothetical protein
MALACGIFGVSKPSTSQSVLSVHARFLLIKLDPNYVHLTKSYRSDLGKAEDPL